MSDILQTIFSPACLFTGYAIALPIQILYDGLLAYIIPPKSKRAYWVIVIAVAVVLILFRPLYPTEIRGMLGIFQSIVLPICLMTGSVPKRVIVCSLAMVLMAVAELTGAVIWVSSTGLEMMNDQLALTYAPLTIFMGLVGYGFVMTPAMIGMGKVVHRFFPDAKKDRRGRRASGAASPVWMRRLALFPLMQVPLIFIVLGICFSVTRGETAFVAASTAILLLCAAIDALLFLQMRRSAERQRAEIKAALLEERLAGYLCELTAVQELLGDTARLRHDLRNHQAVVATLCERGDRRAALDYLEGAVVALRPVRVDAAGVFSGAIDGVLGGDARVRSGNGRRAVVEALMTVLAPKHLFMLLCAAMPIQMLYYWLLQRAIPPKSKKAYWVVGVSLSLVVAALRPIMPEVLRGSFGMVLSVLVPIFLLGGPLVRRISVCCIGMICMAVGELSGGLFWIAVTGLEVMSPDYAFANAGAYVASGIVGYGMVMTPCMLGLAKFCRRFFPDAVTTAASRKGSGRTQNAQDMRNARDAQDARAGERAGKQASGEVGARGAQAAVEVGVQAAAEVGMQASDRSAEGSARSLWLQRIALLPLVQLPFVFLLLLISYNLLRGETHYVVWSAGLLFACVIVDLLLFVQISRSMESRRTEIEAALLEERLAGYLRESAAVQGLLDDTARLRHDLRNHQAVVATLCERGDRAAALGYLEDVVNSL